MALARVFGVEAEWLPDEAADAVPQQTGSMRFELSVSALDWAMAALAVAGTVLHFPLPSAGGEGLVPLFYVLLYLLRSLLMYGKYLAFGWLVRILPLSMSRGTAKVCRITGWTLFAFLALVWAAYIAIALAVFAPAGWAISDSSGGFELLINFIESVLDSDGLFVAAGLLLGLGHRHR